MLVRFDPSVFSSRFSTFGGSKIHVSGELWRTTPPHHPPFLVFACFWPCAAPLRLKASEGLYLSIPSVFSLVLPLATGTAVSRWNTKHSAAPKGTHSGEQIETKSPRVSSRSLSLHPSVFCALRLHLDGIGTATAPPSFWCLGSAEADVESVTSYPPSQARPPRTERRQRSLPFFQHLQAPFGRVCQHT
jgi:hypothetical protein